MSWTNLAKWLFFSVLLALLPFAFNYLRLETRGQSVTLGTLLGSGELLLVSAAISAAAVGEIIGSGKDQVLPKIIAGGGSILILALASMQFADITVARTLPDYKSSFVVSSSVFLFACSVLAGAGCIALGEK